MDGISEEQRKKGTELSMGLPGDIVAGLFFCVF